MASTKLQRTFSQAATSNKIGTFSFWMKRSSLTGEQVILASPYGGSGRSFIRLENASGQIYATINNASDAYIPNMLFRDLSAWYHIVLAIDLTQSTSTDRLKFYVNGNLVTSYATQNPPSNAETISWGQNGILTDIGYDTRDNGGYLNALLSHVNWIDGTAYDATAFGETDATTGQWKIKTSPSVTYGTNGFFILKNGNSLTDQSGNNNNFTLASGTLTKTEDCPSNVFSVWNSLAKHSDVSLYNGNTRAVFDNYGVWKFVYSTLGASSGKYYYEVKVENGGSDSSIGIMEMDTATNEQGTSDNVGKNTESVGYQKDGTIKKNNVNVQTGLGSISNGEILGIAMDLDNNTVQFYLQGVARGTAVSIASDKTYAFATSGYTSAEHQTNFGNGYFETTAVSSAGTNASGNGIFEYDVPANFTALSTKGLNL